MIGTLYRRTLGTTGTWAQVDDGKGVCQMGEDRLGLHEELLWVVWHGREAHTSGGGRQAGALFRWAVAPRPGQPGGGGEQVQIEMETA